MATPPDFVAGQVLTAAEMNKIGFWTVKNETVFTAVSTFNADNVFTSDFTFYRINLRYQTSSNNGINMKFRVGGVAASTNYNITNIYNVAPSSVGSAVSTGQTSFSIGGTTNGAYPSMAIIDITGVQLAESTSILSQNAGQHGGFTTNNYWQIYAGNHSTTTAYDGFEINIPSGNMTGVYSVYGYNE